MGELARFEDIRIKMYPMDTQKHKEPHFHIILSDGNKASISIATGKLLEGKINKMQSPNIIKTEVVKEYKLAITFSNNENFLEM